MADAQRCSDGDRFLVRTERILLSKISDLGKPLIHEKKIEFEVTEKMVHPVGPPSQYTV
jgi:hypothetical protein